MAWAIVIVISSIIIIIELLIFLNRWIIKQEGINHEHPENNKELEKKIKRTEFVYNNPKKYPMKEYARVSMEKKIIEMKKLYKKRVEQEKKW